MIPAITSNTPPAAISGVQASNSNLQLTAVLHGAGVATLEDMGWIRVTGDDRLRWLNGMATNAVQDLALGTGSYNFFLNAQGRIQADGYIFASPDQLLVETSRRQVAALIPYLDHYIIMDDVELADVTESRHGITVIGPKAATLLSQLGFPVGDIGTLESRMIAWHSVDVAIIHAHSPLVPRYELWVNAPQVAAQFLDALKVAGAVPCEAPALESLRILEGTPLYGTDIRDRDLPQETNQTRALHFAKGCYLGQEIVERIRSRGNVHRTFAAFRLDGSLPAAGTHLESAGKQVGELTSVASIPLEEGVVQLALGYIRREALDRGEPLQYAGETAAPVAIPYSAVQTQLQVSDSPAS
jgi:folate-binding protein YgfZ